MATSRFDEHRTGNRVNANKKVDGVYYPMRVTMQAMPTTTLCPHILTSSEAFLDRSREGAKYMILLVPALAVTACSAFRRNGVVGLSESQVELPIPVPIPSILWTGGAITGSDAQLLQLAANVVLLWTRTTCSTVPRRSSESRSTVAYCTRLAAPTLNISAVPGAPLHRATATCPSAAYRAGVTVLG
ncbi:hypothetical protein PYCCODRAFT_1440592 [Trametes coccinea BRFM310]|uniref:Uncharacterized protein n=1 Tax=Trametes coccinea (strain BRFM310) TaxID=1353009 RepID=A0A1Y2I746_TRAC3|nr:hypothetical protein PYCCODRAFT_1440592 [Trametes coccinea BRFM310]